MAPRPVSQELKHFNSGVSQQPPALRSPEQLEEQLNCMSSESEGLIKRPPTVHVADLGTPFRNEKPFIHTIKRDTFEKYLVVCDGETIRVFDTDGRERSVKVEGAAQAYIRTVTPRENIRMCTVADHTFILNKEHRTAMSTKKSPDLWDTQGLLVNVKNGQYGRTYAVHINGSLVASYASPDGGEVSHAAKIATDYIAEQLAAGARKSGWLTKTGPSWVYIYKDVEKPSTTIERPIQPTMDIYDLPRYVGWLEKIRPWPTTGDFAGRHAYTVRFFNFTRKESQSLRDEVAYNRLKAIDLLRAHKWIVTNKLEEAFVIGYGFAVDYPTGTETITIPSTGDPTINSYAVYDGFDNSAALGIHTSVPKFSDLPRTAPNGFTVRVQGEIDANGDDYYVRFDETQNLWVETCKPNIEVAFDASSMPHLLASNADGTFTLKVAAWDERTIGDDDSNPIPSFIGKKLGDIFFFRNRLGFLAGENRALSESASFFNFWMTTATSVLDTDTIDGSVSHNAVINLRHAVLFDDAVVLIADNVQFMLRSDGVLTPKSATTLTLGEYPCSPLTRPVMAGRRMYYASDRSGYAAVREFYAVGTVDDAKLTNDISSHIQHYIPEGVYSILSNNTESLLLLLTEGDESAVYVYKFLFSEEKRLQSAWSKWDFGSGVRILGGGSIDAKCYLIIQRGDHIFLEYINLGINSYDLYGETYRVYADRKQILYSEEAITQVDFAKLYGFDPAHPPDNHWCIILEDKRYIEITPNELVNGIYPSTIPLQGTLVIGAIYPCRITLSPLMVTTEKGRLTTGRLQLRYLTVSYANSGLFDVVVQTAGSTGRYRMAGKKVGNSTVGEIEWLTGTFRAPLQSQNTNCTITIDSTNPIAFNVIGAAWEGVFYERSRRI